MTSTTLRRSAKASSAASAFANPANAASWKIRPRDCCSARRMDMRTTIAILASSLAFVAALPASAAETDWFVVDTILTRTGAISGDVHRYGLPRSDLQVSLDGLQLKPG